MTKLEYLEARRALPELKRVVQGAVRGTEQYYKGLDSYLEAVITVKGHSLSMDAASERKRMARLVSSAFKDVLR